MMPQTNTETLAARFAPHLELLQDFFRSRGVLFWKSENLRFFAARMATPGSFYEDVSSLLRTIIFRENMDLTRVELLDLLCIAVSGSPCDGAQLPEAAEVGQLLLFVNVVLLSIRKRTIEAGAEINSPRDFSSIPLKTTDCDAADVFSGEGTAALETGQTEEKAVPTGDNAHASPPEIALPLSFLQDTVGVDAEVDSSPDAPQPVLAEPEKHPASSALDGVNAFSGAVPAATSVPQQQDRQPREPLGVETPHRRALLSRPATLVAAAVLLLLAVLMVVSRRPSGRKRDPASAASSSDGLQPDSPSITPPAVNTVPGATALTSAADHTGMLPLAGDLPVAGPESRKPAAGTPAIGDQPLKGAQGATPANSRGESQQIRSYTSAPAASLRDESANSSTDDSEGTRSSDRVGKGKPPRAHDAFSVQHSSRKGLFSVSSGVMGANLISAPAPEYPILAKVARIEGQVILQAVVSRRGTVVATHVLQGHYLLRSAAEGCVRKWRYRPYLVNGRPTDVETIVFVQFQLHR